jgi:hypothetical protein
MWATSQRFESALTDIDTPYGATLGHIRDLCSVRILFAAECSDPSQLLSTINELFEIAASASRRVWFAQRLCFATFGGVESIAREQCLYFSICKSIEARRAVKFSAKIRGNSA